MGRLSASLDLSVVCVFHGTATTEFYTLSLHDALPILPERHPEQPHPEHGHDDHVEGGEQVRSEEHTSELQSPYDLVCRLLLEKKNTLQRERDKLDRALGSTKDMGGLHDLPVVRNTHTA